MKIKWTLDHLDYACAGLDIRDKTREMLADVFCKGLSVNDTSALYGVTPQNIHRVVRRVEENLRQRLKSDGKLFVPVLIDASRLGAVRELEQ